MQKLIFPESILVEIVDEKEIKLLEGEFLES